MAFQLPTYSKCCYCIPLRIGVLLIGYISIIASCFTLATVSWSIYKVSTYVEDNKNRPTPGHPPAEMAKTAVGLYISFAYYLLVFLFNLTLGVLLVVGTHMNKPNYLRIYVKATMFLFVLSVVLVILTCVFMGFLATVPVLKWSFTILVCVVIVRSYYLEMEEKEKRPAYELQPYTPVQQAPTRA